LVPRHARLPKSIAVLPLRNLGGEPDSELIAEGLAEDLIRQLAGLPEVRVVSQTSSFALKGKGKSMREIGALLDVDGVVEGTLHRVGGRVKVSAQLVRTADDRAIWAGAFEREFRDLFALEDELSAAIAQTLHASLERQGRKENANPEAYAVYLRGLYAMRHSTRAAASEAVALFHEAVEKDPFLARAWSAQAFGWYELGVLADMPALEVAPRARTAALRALELDARLPEAHVALAVVRFFFEANRQGAGESFRRAVELGPNSSEAWSQYASYLMDIGRLEEALAAARRGERLDPLSPAAGRLVASVLYVSRRYDEAIAQSRKVLERGPEVHSAYRELGRAYLAQGLCEEALDAFHRLQDDGFEGEALARCGRREEAREVLAQLKRAADRDPTRRATGVARIYAALGDHTRALEYLERGQREYGYVQRLRDPAWDPCAASQGSSRCASRWAWTDVSGSGLSSDRKPLEANKSRCRASIQGASDTPILAPQTRLHARGDVDTGSGYRHGGIGLQRGERGSAAASEAACAGAPGADLERPA
jgi:TolB-like protein/Flp pilus assembly protein TadD